MDIRALDFHQGRVKVFSLRSKLRSGLYGAAIDNSIASPTDSPLGEWVYQVWLPKYGHFDQMKELEQLNQDAHQLCSRILDLKAKGKIVEAREVFKNFSACSDRILQKLDEAAQKADIVPAYPII